MNCEVTLYHGTGFNSINVPDSAETLIAAANSTTTAAAMDVLDHTNLTSIRIKVNSIEDVMDVDYIRIFNTKVIKFENVYYYVSGFQMTSPDVATLFIIPNYLISTGGPDILQFLDGVIERTTNITDGMQADAHETDEYMTPQDPLCYKQTEMFWGRSLQYDQPSKLGSDDIAVVESMVNLADPIDWEDSILMKAATGETGESEYVYQLQPNLKTSKLRTLYSVDFGIAKSGESSTGSSSMWAPGTSQYLTAQITESLPLMQSLGVTDAIVSSISYPGEYFDTDDGKPGRIYYTVGGRITQIRTSVTKKATGLTLKGVYSDYTYKPMNARIYYGQYNAYGLITASNSQAEYLPEEVIPAVTDYDPEITLILDPRPNGRPYFRYSNYLHLNWAGSETSYKNPGEYLTGSVSGMQWPNSQLIYNGASGSYYDTLRYSNAQQQAALGYTNQREQISNQFKQQYFNYTNAQASSFMDLASSVGNTAMNYAGLGMSDYEEASTYGGKILGGFTGAAKSAASMINRAANWQLTQANTNNALAYAAQSYQLGQELAAANYVQSQVVAPTIACPFNADFARDFVGNGVIAYRYYYTERDLKRIDRLLTMYGIKKRKALEAADFNSRKYFDYVRAQGVSVTAIPKKAPYVTSFLPMYMKDAIAAQLSAGIRVWHTKPDTKYYEPGQNVLK